MLHNFIRRAHSLKTFFASSRDNALCPNKTQPFRTFFYQEKILNDFRTHTYIYIVKYCCKWQSIKEIFLQKVLRSVHYGPKRKNGQSNLTQTGTQQPTSNWSLWRWNAPIYSLTVKLRINASILTSKLEICMLR